MCGKKEAWPLLARLIGGDYSLGVRQEYGLMGQEYGVIARRTPAAQGAMGWPGSVARLKWYQVDLKGGGDARFPLGNGPLASGEVSSPPSAPR